MISCIDSAVRVTADRLHGFFVGWPDVRSPDAHLELLLNSDYAVLAVDVDTGDDVECFTPISDGVLTVRIPWPEVLPAHQGQGIGSELAQCKLAKLGRFKALDLVCDPELPPFYRRLGTQPYTVMIPQDFERQSGE